MVFRAFVTDEGKGRLLYLCLRFCQYFFSVRFLVSQLVS